MKRLHVNDIILNDKIYYSVCCGKIDEIKILRIEGRKALIKYTAYKYLHTLDDIGIDHEHMQYYNHLNFVFDDIADAQKLIMDTEYQHILNKHNRECDYYDRLYDEYHDEYYDIYDEE